MFATTAWEIIATKSGKTIQLGFSARKTRGALISIMQNNGDKIVSELGTDENASAPVLTVEKIELSDGTIITWSGHTMGDFERGQVSR